VDVVVHNGAFVSEHTFVSGGLMLTVGRSIGCTRTRS
jgi:hypothetical protein